MKTNEKERNRDQLMDFPLEEYLNDLETIINIDSGSMDLEGCRKVADFFCAKLKAAYSADAQTCPARKKTARQAVCASMRISKGS